MLILWIKKITFLGSFSPSAEWQQQISVAVERAGGDTRPGTEKGRYTFAHHLDGSWSPDL